MNLDDLMLTDGGLETVLVFHDGIDLPAFAAFPLVTTEEGRDRLAEYFRDFLRVAAPTGAGFVLETPTWRASSGWGAQLGFDREGLRRVSADSVALAHRLRAEWDGEGSVLVSGAMGPRGDGYVPGEMMTSAEAADYHLAQVRDFAEDGVDLVTSFTFSYAEEAIGQVMAAAEVGLPAVVGFTVETDGRLPSGQPLGAAIEAVDAATGGYASWFMVNCAHPSHVAPGLEPGAPWTERVGAVRGNASRLSHAELDEAEVLDRGEPADLAEGTRGLAAALPGLRVVGGCCGTDVDHVAALATAFSAPGQPGGSAPR